MTVVCENESCTEYQIPKSGSDDFEVEEIQCGKCYGPVSEIEEPTT